MRNFSHVDLNLLVTLDVLLSERNVTRAASRLNLSQPSVSVQLGKLREAFDDPLLIPRAGGMLMSARAEQIREPLRDALANLKRVVMAGESFDPSRATNTWRVAAADYGELAILLPVLERLRIEAPATKIAVLESASARITRLAAEGEIDIGLQTIDEVANGLRAHKLFEESYVLVGRQGHPQLRRPPTIHQFCDLDHAVVSPEGGGFQGGTDAVLKNYGLTRRVVLSVPHFLVVLTVIEKTDLVAMLPSRLVRGRPGLALTRAPIEVPGFSMAMVWHERSHHDPSHRWLRDQIIKAVAMPDA